MNLDELLGHLNEITAKQNVVKIGRVKRIRRRIRRDAKGRITVQRNRIRSGIKGYRATGKARLLKRSWKTTRRAKLRRSQLKRKLSMRRRASLGLR
jgi:hypothetical protein